MDMLEALSMADEKKRNMRLIEMVTMIGRENYDELFSQAQSEYIRRQEVAISQGVRTELDAYSSRLNDLKSKNPVRVEIRVVKDRDVPRIVYYFADRLS